MHETITNKPTTSTSSFHLNNKENERFPVKYIFVSKLIQVSFRSKLSVVIWQQLMGCDLHWQHSYVKQGD